MHEELLSALSMRQIMEELDEHLETREAQGREVMYPGLEGDRRYDLVWKSLSSHAKKWIIEEHLRIGLPHPHRLVDSPSAA
ncbi:hypothetical protein D9611_008434 [Ephemerocybe angulata]|uniref:Uncharacterized protein n=1 Tax=Ephemerocybe angulata TaxID=980116 RepID=A0A8H5F5C5_9AGAR|nr:hypothetical protein D9611_008434 [Tulosesus angulatus]